MSAGYAALVELHALRPTRLTRRGKAVRFAAITVGASVCFSAGLALPAPSRAELDRPTVTPVTIYEDGSAHMSDGSTAPENTYPWDCRTMGNHICGSGAEATISADGCTYHPDGSGQCDDTGERIPAMSEQDADLCADVDPEGAVIRWCRP